MRVLILSATTGYQLRAFDEAARTLGFDLTFATNCCDRLDDPWRDRAIPVRFYDEQQSLESIVRAARDTPLDGVIAVGDGPVPLAALAAERLRLPGNPPDAARTAGNKLLTRQALDRAGLPVPWFFQVPIETSLAGLLDRLASITQSARFPCIVKPTAMAASRGVMRADDEDGLAAALERVRGLLARRDVRAQRDPAHGSVLIEGYIAGDEFAVEGVVQDGELQPFALFDKPDPLVGPFFEETIYVTPSRLEPGAQSRILHTVRAACRALGLRHGPVHAEVRVNRSGVFVLEVAARPIGGLCARALKFVRRSQTSKDAAISGRTSLETVLLRHATGSPAGGYEREPDASGVMMIPVPRRGIFKHVEGLDEGRAVSGIEDIVITAKPDQMLVPLPEGASYPGFIFAVGATAVEVEAALRRAHAALRWVIERPLDVIS